MPTLSRRHFLTSVNGAMVSTLMLARSHAAPAPFTLRYLVASSLYGNLPLAEILPEVRQTGAAAIELWARPHGTQRDEAEALGVDRVAAELHRHRLRFAGTSRYDLGPYALAEEFAYVRRLGGEFVVTNSRGEAGLRGDELRTRVRALAESLRPRLEPLAGSGMVHLLENHSGSLIDSPDAIRWLLDFTSGLPLQLALAPYHLPQDPSLLARLIRDIGPRLGLFYAWQHGRGSTGPLTTEEQLMQLPGRGPLEFAPLLAALKEIRFSGWTEIFMHPVPRGVPILATAAEVTAEINRARDHLERLLRSLA